MRYVLSAGEITLLSFLYQGEGKRKYNVPVGGKTRLVKELFILEKGYGIKTGYEFAPYYFGPFCPEIYRDLADLEASGLARIQDTAAGKEIALTPIGVQEAIKNVRTLQDSVISRMINCKERYNSMPLDDLVSYVYSHWPKFTDKSLNNPDNIMAELASEFKKAGVTEADITTSIRNYRKEKRSKADECV